MSELTKAYLRTITKIIDPETLDGVMERFEGFCSDQSLNKDLEAWNLFWRDIGWNDLLALSGTTFSIINEDGEEEEVEFIQPYYWRGFDTPEAGMFGPEHACLESINRFGKFTPAWKERNYPIDSDIQLYVEVKGGSKDHPRTELVSYNQLAGLTTSGRRSHWTDPEQYKGETPRNTFFGDGNMDCNWFADPLYRVTPEGQPTVEDLLPTGTVVQCSFTKKEYIVTEVNKYEHYPIERPEGTVFEYYALLLIDKATNKKGYSATELVAIDGRICKLYMTNEDEYFILGHVEEMPEAVEEPEFDDEDEDEEYSCCTIEYEEEVIVEVQPEPIMPPSVPLCGEQLSLF